METDFFFADMKMKVTLQWSEKGTFTGLTDNELSALRQIIYLTLNCFTYQRALFLTDAVESLERIKQVGSTDKPETNGG